jgi:hypothetical protein
VSPVAKYAGWQPCGLLVDQGQLGEMVGEWASFARTMLPWAKTTSELALRDHGRAILLAIAEDMKTSQSEAERSTKARGSDFVAIGATQTAAKRYGRFIRTVKDEPRIGAVHRP